MAAALVNRFRSIFNPHMYHGWGRKRTYFEGWYYKLVSADEQHAIALIPGIAMDAFGNQEAFIQVFDGKNSHAEFFTFPASQFKANEKRFEIEIAGNQFSSQGLKLDLPSLQGELSFTGQMPWPSTWYSPGIMGPGAFVPRMQCYHGVLSMNHTMKGELQIGDCNIDFTAGKGYLEKDWGRSFPKAYFWMQCNHFDGPMVSVKASVARVPWMGHTFTGFIAGLQLPDRLLQFTTYHWAKLNHAHSNSNSIELVMRNRKYELTLQAAIHETTALMSPIKGLMDGKVNESMTSNLHVMLKDRNSGDIIISETGRNAAVDKGGAVELLHTGASIPDIIPAKPSLGEITSVLD